MRMPEVRAKPDLRAERQTEPEARALVAEELAQVEVVTESTDRVEDPDRPHGEHPGDGELVPRLGGTGPERP